MFKIINEMTPVYLKDISSKSIRTSVCNLRTSKEDVAIPRARTDCCTRAKIWKALPEHLKRERSFESF